MTMSDGKRRFALLADRLVIFILRDKNGRAVNGGERPQVLDSKVTICAEAQMLKWRRERDSSGPNFKF